MSAIDAKPPFPHSPRPSSLSCTFPAASRNACLSSGGLPLSSMDLPPPSGTGFRAIGTQAAFGMHVGK